MAILDKANAFCLRPLAGDAAQAEPRVLDFGAAELGGENNLAGYLVVNTSHNAGTVTIKDSDDGEDFGEEGIATITITSAGIKTAIMPKHKRFVKAELAGGLTTSNADVYVGALPYKK